jgi:hypothetical protein
MQESHCYASDRQSAWPSTADTSYTEHVEKQLKLIQHYHSHGCAVVVPAPGTPSKGVDYSDTVEFVMAASREPPLAKRVNAIVTTLNAGMLDFLGSVVVHACKVKLVYESPVRGTQKPDAPVVLTREGSVTVGGLMINYAPFEGFGLFGPPALDFSMGDHMECTRYKHAEDGWFDTIETVFDGIVFLPLAK